MRRDAAARIYLVSVGGRCRDTFLVVRAGGIDSVFTADNETLIIGRQYALAASCSVTALDKFDFNNSIAVATRPDSLSGFSDATRRCPIVSLLLFRRLLRHFSRNGFIIFVRSRFTNSLTFVLLVNFDPCGNISVILSYFSVIF